MLKDTLLQQFTACYDENGWFVAVRNVIEGVTVEQAVWKPEGADNSIWETLAHLSYYNNAYLQRFKGIDYEYDVADNDATFAAAKNPAVADWQAEVARFDSIMTEWRELLEAAQEAAFEKNVPQKSERKRGDLIADINAHNAHHSGQIVLLRKLQGSWKPEKGVS